MEQGFIIDFGTKILSLKELSAYHKSIIQPDNIQSFNQQNLSMTVLGRNIINHLPNDSGASGASNARGSSGANIGLDYFIKPETSYIEFAKIDGEKSSKQHNIQVISQKQIGYFFKQALRDFPRTNYIILDNNNFIKYNIKSPIS